MRTIPYRPEIDGLRALAVSAVILFHLNPNLVPAGFVGVDIFFVISGYLITSIIWAENSAGRFTMAGFWSRRIRRILPALGVMVVAVLLVILALGLPSLINGGGKQAIATTACASNYRMVTLISNYWAPQSDRILLLHTWSLAVEEQFYFFFPLFLAGAFIWLKPERTRWVLIGVFMLSASWCAWQTVRSPSEAFFLMPTRAWELLAGGLLAVFETRLRNVNSVFAVSLAALGCLFLATSLLLSSSSAFPWPLAALPVVGASLFIGFGAQSIFVSRVFACRPAVAVGKASYSLYLWHWPCLVIGGFLASALEVEWIRSAALVLGVAIGWISYRHVESLGRRESFVKIYAPALVVMMISLSTFCAFKKPPVIPNEFVSTGWKGAAYDARFQPNFAGVRLGIERSAEYADVVMLGDSHALSLAFEFDTLMQRKGLNGIIFASGGTRIVNWRQTRYDLDAAARKQLEFNRDDFIAKFKPRVIILDARWETLDDQEALVAVEQLITHIFSLSAGSKLIIIGQPPHFPQGHVKMHEWLNWRRRLGAADLQLKVPPNLPLIRMEAALSQLATAKKNIRYVPVNDLFPSINGRVSPVEGTTLLYEDSDHLSDAGAQRILQRLEPLLSSQL